MISEWEGTAWAGSVPELQTRSDDTSIADLLARFNVRSTAWRPIGIREALSVPAIFGAVSFISNTVGSLSLQAFRKGVKLEPDERPRVIVRPDPFRRPREFFRDTAYNIASRGEAWWWIAMRDLDGSALSVLNLPPQEVFVEENDRDPRYPTITWRGKKMPNADVVQITYVQEPGDLRGRGPLQMCGAAVSVAVEAQEWAANYYSGGGMPSLILASEVDMTETEAADLRARWMAIPNNTPHITTPGLKVDEFGQNVQAAPMLDTSPRVGDVARMFMMPSSLLSYATPGSSLTYQNVGQELDKFTRTCLWPNYLEPIEQAMSDLLTRSTVARFNVEALLRADVKTRWEVYELAGKVIGVDEAATLARQAEGLEPGDIEAAPVPFSPPQAFPSALMIEPRSVQLREVRCDRCDRLVGRVAGAAELFCRHCKVPVSVAA